MSNKLNISVRKQTTLVAIVLVYVASLCYWPANVNLETSDSPVLIVKEAADPLFQPAFFKSDESSGTTFSDDNFHFIQICAALLALTQLIFIFKPAIPVVLVWCNFQRFCFSIFPKGP